MTPRGFQFGARVPLARPVPDPSPGSLGCGTLDAHLREDGRHWRSQWHTAGFTLLEMLLVLAILVAITAVTIPVVGRMYDTHRIHQAALEVRTTLSAARLRAVDGGEAFEFRFEPDGRHLVILARREQGNRFGGEAVSPSVAKPHSSRAVHVELPESLHFWTADAARERIQDRTLRALADGDRLGNRTWSVPIVFAPDGTSTSADFEIRDDQGRAVRLRVRGLTGAASASTPLKRSDA